MILTGTEFINKKMKLAPGDRFLVEVTEGLNGATKRMAKWNGKWLTVSSVAENEVVIYKRYSPVRSTAYHAHRFDGWRTPYQRWFWYHMAAIELVNQTVAYEGPVLLEALPDI